MGSAGMRHAAGVEDSPFLRARREWDDRYAHQARAVRNWQIATLLTLVLAAGLGLGLVRLATQSRITPYVVEVDRHGDAVAFGPADRLAEPTDQILRYQLAQYLHFVRTVTADANAQQHLIDRAYAYTHGEAVAFLNRHFQRTNPFEAAGRGTRRVEVTSILPIAKGTWQVQWTETSYRMSRSTAEHAWQAVLVVEQDPPTTSDTLLVNPLGLYVTEIDWQQQTL